MENQTQDPRPVLQILQEISLKTGTHFGVEDEGPQPWMKTNLTEDEVIDALNKARSEKYYTLKNRDEYKKENERIAFVKGIWAVEDMMQYVKWRAVRWCGFSKDNGKDGKPLFLLDENNATIIHALCYYFLNNPLFEQIRIKNEDGSIINPNWRLNKNILLCGNVGRGKTKIMELFAINKRQNYELLKARDLAALFAKKGEQGGYEMIEQFSKLHKPIQVKHEDNLWQEYMGLCIDDLGTEDEKVNFGNRSNVIAEIIDGRDANPKLATCMTHMTTNLTGTGIKEKYGERIYSRIIGRYNVIELAGVDRRITTPNP